MRLTIWPCIAACIATSMPASAQVSLTTAQGQELKLQCKTVFRPVPKVDWDDFCSCIAANIESKFTRDQYVAWTNALAARSPPPNLPVARQMWQGCIEATTPLEPGTQLRLPAKPR